ncbi:MAG: class I SAM-dependent methyltransferase [Solirubrobacteraceae bacterium]
MAAPDTSEEILDVNRRYHDAAAAEYDAKWGVDFGAVGRAQVLGKVEKLLGRGPGPFARSLEIGAGTGYFTLNLMQEAVIESGACTDVSPGMLDALRENARRLSLEVESAACDAAALPFEDASFDLLLGHAVLHHLPELERSFTEFARVLRPGGVLLFAGEPSRHGDRIAAVPKRAGMAAAPLWRRLVGARELNGSGTPDDHALGGMVDVHAFTPAELGRHAAAAGFEGVRVRGEELLANWFGWFNRTVEASAVHADIPHGWFRYAYRGYIVLQRVDATVLEPHLPAAGFYNLMLAARKPA